MIEGLLTRVTGAHTLLEPAIALGGAAVSELLGVHKTTRALLQSVIHDRVHGLDGRFHIARLDKVEHTLAMVRPYAGEIIGLQLQSHGKVTFWKAALSGHVAK